MTASPEAQEPSAKVGSTPMERPAVTQTQTPLRYSVTLVAHLVRREIAQTSRFSLIGAGWPLIRQMSQLGILVLAFSAVLDLGIDNYAVFVFCGLLGWSWFIAAMMSATDSIQANRQLAMRPGFPSIVLPVVAAIVPFVDVLFALPVLLAMLIGTGTLHPDAIMLLPLLALQAIFTVGLAWILSSLAVFFRDIPNLVNVVLLMSFYLTPVYFELDRIPDKYQWILRLNPMAVLLESDRAALLGTPWPPAGSLVGVVVVAFALLFGGYRLFNRLSPSFSDEL